MRQASWLGFKKDQFGATMKADARYRSADIHAVFPFKFGPHTAELIWTCIEHHHITIVITIELTWASLQYAGLM
jgi:hypothetical protein